MRVLGVIAAACAIAVPLASGGPSRASLHIVRVASGLSQPVYVTATKSQPQNLYVVERLKLPEGSRLISIMRDGKAEIAVGSTELQPGDQVLAILQPGKEDELRRVLLKS